MAGEVEESITLQAKSLPTGSISFGRFELESLCWERRSIFPHNRYLEEVEKYSTPGSVTKKKEYFEAHFKKKALLHHVPEENKNEAETPHFESTIGDNDSSIMGDFIGYVNRELVEFSSNNGYTPAVPDDHESVELQKEEISTTELIIKNSSFNDEKFAKQLNEPLSLDGTLQSQSRDNDMQLEGGPWAIVEDKTTNVNANSKKQAENGDVSGKIRKSKKKNECIQMKTQKVSIKSNDAVERKIGKSQSRLHLPTQLIPKKPISNSNSVTSGGLRRADKQNMSAKVEKQRILKVSSPYTESGNLKIMASNMKAKACSEIKSEEVATAKKVGINTHPVDKRQSAVRQYVDRVKLVSKEEEKQNSTVFNFKSSERAEKRKEYNLKLEKRLHAKEAEMNEIQAKTEVVKEAELKQLRKSLNFKASPMPSFYQETTSRVSHVKKASTVIPIKCQEKSIPSLSSNQPCDHSCNWTISSSISNSMDDCSSPAANLRYHNCNPTTSPSISGSAGVCSSPAANRSSSGESIKLRKKSVKSKNSGTRNNEARKSGIRAGVRGIVGESVAVHVAS